MVELTAQSVQTGETKEISGVKDCFSLFMYTFEKASTSEAFKQINLLSLKLP